MAPHLSTVMASYRRGSVVCFTLAVTSVSFDSCLSCSVCGRSVFNSSIHVPESELDVFLRKQAADDVPTALRAHCGPHAIYPPHHIHATCSG